MLGKVVRLIGVFSFIGIPAFSSDAQQPVKMQATISGVVSRNTGMLPVFIPIVGGKVYLEKFLDDLAPNAGTGISLTLYSLIDSAKTDGSGNYSIDSVITGATGYRLTFTAKGYRSQQLYFTVRKDTIISSQLSPVTEFYTVTGSVTWDCPMCGGLLSPPVPGCTVSVRFPKNIPPVPIANAGILPIGRTEYRGITDSKGLFLIDSISGDSGAIISDSVMVSAFKEGYITERYTTVLHAKKTDSLHFSLSKAAVRIQNRETPVRSHFQFFTYKQGIVTLVLAGNQAVSLGAYRPDGRLLENFFTKEPLSAGRYSINLDKAKLGRGLVIIRAKGDNFDDAIQITLF